MAGPRTMEILSDISFYLPSGEPRRLTRRWLQWSDECRRPCTDGNFTSRLLGSRTYWYRTSTCISILQTEDRIGRPVGQQISINRMTFRETIAALCLLILVLWLISLSFTHISFSTTKIYIFSARTTTFQMIRADRLRSWWRSTFHLSITSWSATLVAALHRIDVWWRVCKPKSNHRCSESMPRPFGM